LDRADVDLQDLTVLVREGKGRKDRLVPLHLDAAIAVETYVSAKSHEEPAVFVSRQGRRISVRALRDVVYRVAREAALTKRVHPHTLRHTVATLLIEKDVDVFAVADILGHASIATTQRYVHTAQGRKRAPIPRCTSKSACPNG
jgi:site-specific recombinase XerD